jgi:hypothetical protein
MSSWLHERVSSQNLHLGATALVSGVVVASTIFGVQALRRQIAVEELKSSIPNVDEEHEAQRVYVLSVALCISVF